MSDQDPGSRAWTGACCAEAAGPLWTELSDFAWVAFGTDRGVLLTFVTMVETEYSLTNLEHPERVLSEVQKGYYKLLWLFSQGKKLTPEAMKKLHLTFKRLRRRLHRLQPTR